MADTERLICASADLSDGGDGVRFEVAGSGGSEFAFVVRHRGVVFGFINRCAHVPVQLDWIPGKFFDTTGDYLICSVHGAHYEPSSGCCVLGPCKGRKLQQLTVQEREGSVFLLVPDAPN